MTEAPAILLIDAGEGDRALAQLLLDREFPGARISGVADPLAAAYSLGAERPDVVVIAADVPWANFSDLVASIKRRSAATGIVLFGQEADILARVLDPGLACDGVIRKTSAGFLALPAIVREVIQRKAGEPLPAPEAAAEPQPAGPLPRTDQDLREIALVFSHDFREPVQQIVRLARRGLVANSADAAIQSLRHVLESADRASAMLDGMIEYLTVTGRNASPAAVDLNASLNQALENLKAGIDDSQAEVRAAPLPVVPGDEHQLVHLFQNLVSNAIKFRSKERPVVTISCEPNGDAWHIAVRDNGIGIPQAFIERIFELGKRLHTREEYPGTGIGLALCRRIVERHGGRIWAESHEGQGSTFHLVMARSSPDLERGARA